MNNKIGLLAALAALQLALIGVFWFGGGEAARGGGVMGIDPQAAVSLQISDGEAATSLIKSDGEWRAGELPADPDKIADVLEKLSAMSGEGANLWPVATSPSAADRFEVGEANFQRRVTLVVDGGEEAVLLFGTSPGYQLVHARLVGSDEVYAVKLSNYELGLSADDWLDKTLLALAAAPSSVVVTPTEGEPQSLVARDDAWSFNDVPADPDEAQTYVNRFTTLRVLGLAPSAAVPVVATIVAETEAGERTFEVRRGEEESADYLFLADGETRAFRVPTYVAEQLLMTDADFSIAVPDAAQETLDALIEPEALLQTELAE